MKFDAYTMRARVLPAVLVALPLAVLVSFAAFSPIAGIVPAIGGFALAYWAAEFVRQQGVRLERRLTRRWGGMPTNAQLRLTSRDMAAVLRRRAALELATGYELPDPVAESKSAVDADIEIERVVRLGAARIRDTKVEAHLVHQENIAYGFRRNLRALKPLGLTSAALSVAIALVAAWNETTILTFVLALDILLAILWIAVVRDEWVHDQAKKYAERFFVAIETIARNQPATRS